MAPTGGAAGSKGVALRDAATRGDAQRVGVILQTADAVINECDENGCTSLQRAAADGHSEIVRLLMHNGADPNKQDGVHGNTALHEAAWKGYSRCVALLATRAALHIRNNGGFAPLHLACQNGHNQTCREILLAGCDPDIQNNYGDTSLHTSARYGHAGVTRILISAECHVSDQNKNGDTALHIAAAMGRRKLTRILLEAGCDRSLKNKQNETAKDIALRKDLHEIVDILNLPATKAKKEAKKKEKKREKSVERTEDNPDAAAEKLVKKKSKDVDHKYKEKRKVKSVHFEGNSVHWSPYGCHYYPDPRSFPKPKLDSLPKEPLKKGEQYYLDLAGNICKGPVGVGYTCYCAPFFRHMEDKLNRDKIELKHHIDKAHEKLDLKVSNLERKTQGQISELTRCVAAERVLCRERQQHLEHWLTRGMMFRASERARKLEFSPKGSVDIAPLKRTRSLEMLDVTSRTWNIIKTFDERQRDTARNRLNRSARKTSKSADVLDVNDSPKSKFSNNDDSKSSDALSRTKFNGDRSCTVSGKSSERSLSATSYGTEINKRTKRYSRDSSQNVTAEIHVRSNNVSISQSPSIHDVLSLSENDDRHSMRSRNSNKSIMKNKDRGSKSVKESLNTSENLKDYMVSQNDCIGGIEQDGYIKISRCDDGSRSQIDPKSDNNDISVDGSTVVENGPRRSVHELVARIQERQLIEEIQRTSRSPTRSPLGKFIDSSSRPTSPSYSGVASNFPVTNSWQNNTIPLSENTHFNTIEPINQTVQPTSNPAPQQSVKSSKKFSFHNLIPFPTRKMFNFHHKSDGNQSESSDEEDAPIRSPLEPGLMQNSNLLTTLPLPNYENMMSNQNAQPQSPNKIEIEQIPVRGNILPIPKDAYFHEIPNKQRFHENPTFPKVNDMRIPSQHVHPHFKVPYVQPNVDNNMKLNDSAHINYGRNRNPVYSSNGLLGEMMHDHIDRELSRTPHSYTSQLDQNAEIEISNINGCANFHGQYKGDPMRPLLNSNHYRPHNHPVNEFRGSIESQMVNYPHIANEEHLQNRMQNLAINTHLTELQSQLDRDSHNDSGYSTKVYGSSQGASPSLSGNVDCLESNLNQKLGLVMNRNIMTNSVGHSPHPHIGASSLV